MSNSSLTDREVGIQVRTDTKDRLIDAASELFALKGYTATSIDEITNACNIRKPSFYGHFESKAAIAIAAISNLHNYCREFLFVPVVDDHVAPEERVTHFIENFKLFFNACPNYALIGFFCNAYCQCCG